MLLLKPAIRDEKSCSGKGGPKLVGIEGASKDQYLAPSTHHDSGYFGDPTRIALSNWLPHQNQMNNNNGWRQRLIQEMFYGRWLGSMLKNSTPPVRVVHCGFVVRSVILQSLED